MTGIFPATVTPFDRENRVNAAAMTALLEFNLKQGASGFFIGGSSAECFLLSEQERIQTFEIASAFKGQTTLIAHVGALSTGEAIRYANAAKSLGFQYISATPPFYYGFSAKQVAQYYYDISAAADMPVLIYNFPGNTGKPFDLSNPDTRALFCSDAVCGVKHTNLDFGQFERIRALNPSLILMNGYDDTMAAGIALGAHGSIGSTFNFTLPYFQKIYNAAHTGDYATARDLQQKINNLLQTMYTEGLIPAIKYALGRYGIDAGQPRAPFAPLTPEQCARIDASIEQNLLND